MLRLYRLRDLDDAGLDRLCRRNPTTDPTTLDLCREVFEAVQARGDAAVREFTRRFDGARTTNLRVPKDEFDRAIDSVPEGSLAALRRAARNIETFHRRQKREESPVEVEPGVECWRVRRPIEAVGLYVPGGGAVLPSTALMLGIPARLAGCPKVSICVPPRPDGSVTPEVLAAARLAGIDQVFRIGGIQAIAAWTHGTESVPRVDKIFGPGNRWVQAAKAWATFQGVAIDMIAGPSEVLVIADADASPDTVASDLLSQAEHGSDSQAILVSTSETLIRETGSALRRKLADLPRAKVAAESLAGSFAVLAPSLEEAFAFSNRYAPEHLIVQVGQPRRWIDSVDSAGSVFLGPWSPETAGDYASGTNHTLPTSGAARAVSGVSVDSFLKWITFQELTPEGLRGLAPTLLTLARIEGLEGHARAVLERTERLASERGPKA